MANCDRIAWECKSRKGWGKNVHVSAETFFPKDAIANRDYDEGWIPIAYEVGTGNYLAVDLSPGPKGIRGQLIDFGADIHNLGVLAPSWGEFLLSYAKLLESGALGTIDPDSDDWCEPFLKLFDRAALDALVLWAMDGRWPITEFPRAWCTSDVTGLARNIDSTRDFVSMPILADALAEAGCDNAAILGHCRDQQCTHAKGCWVVDSVLRGKVEGGRWCSAFPREPQ
jgi:hypothetical protein